MAKKSNEPKKVTKTKEKVKTTTDTSELTFKNEEKEIELHIDNVNKVDDNISTLNTMVDATYSPCDEKELLLKEEPKKMYETVIIDEMNIKELMAYKDAIDKLIIYHTNICQMNRGFDDKIYNESHSLLNEFRGFLSKINKAIKNKIFSLK